MKMLIAFYASLLTSSITSSMVNAVGFRELIDSATHKRSSADVVEGAAKAGQNERRLPGNKCWTKPTPAAAWHPKYSAGWTNGFCQFTIDCNSPAYSSEAACCKSAYGGQISGYCLSKLPSPPTTSPTDAGGLDVYYPDYDTAWPEAGCINTRPMPSGRPTYSSMIACCKGAYGGQLSGKCLSMLPSPPTTSPTSPSYEADFWYPDYDTAWTEAGCSNALPLPFRNKNDRPSYSSALECCRGAYGGQVSGACLGMLPFSPTASPTSSSYQADFWYPDYDTAWTEAGCSNALPLPFKNKNDRPNYSNHLACCKGAYAGQMSGACLSQLAAPPTSSPTGSGGADFYYRDYSKAWNEGTCINTLPLPIQVTEWNSFSTQEECCKTAFGGQVSHACICALDEKPQVCYDIKVSTVTNTIDPTALGVTIPAILPSGSALTTLVRTLKEKIKLALEAATGKDVVDITIISIGGVPVNQRRLGQALATRGRSLAVNDVVYRANVEFSCLPGECAQAEGVLQSISEAAICNANEKCIGVNACTGKTGEEVGCNSCVGGNDACLNNNAIIGANSCHGPQAACLGVTDPWANIPRTIGDGSCTSQGILDGACREFRGGSLGENSCNGRWACAAANGDIGDNSCNGEEACKWINSPETVSQQVSIKKIGSGSCNAFRACFDTTRDIAPGTCNQPYECCEDHHNSGWCVEGGVPNPTCESCEGTDACKDNTGQLGCNSCQGNDACLGNNADIGANSCHGPVAACLGPTEQWAVDQPRTIGAGSCTSTDTTDGACRQFLGASIGDASCNGNKACAGANGNIGNNACSGEEACKWINGPDKANGQVSSNSIGDGSCNAFRACFQANTTIAPGTCNNPYECCEDPFNSGWCTPP